MAYVAVDLDGGESIHIDKPERGNNEWVKEFAESMPLPKGTIAKLIGYELTWNDEPVELKEKCNPRFLENVKFKVPNEYLEQFKKLVVEPMPPDMQEEFLKGFHFEDVDFWFYGAQYSPSRFMAYPEPHREALMQAWERYKEVPIWEAIPELKKNKPTRQGDMI